MRSKRALSFFLALTIFIVPATSAEPVAPVVGDTQLTLNGISVYQQLRNDVFLATLFTENASSSAGPLLDPQLRVRMDMKIVANKFTSRRLKRLWKESIRINNEIEDTLLHARNIREFANLFSVNLETGDHIVIDQVPGQGVSVSLNGQRLGGIDSADFFPVVLRAWIGETPPTKDFKKQILGSDTSRNTELFAMYDNTFASDARVAEISGSVQPEPEPEPEPEVVAEQPAPVVEQPAEVVAAVTEEPAPVVSEPVTDSTVSDTTLAEAAQQPADQPIDAAAAAADEITDGVADSVEGNTQVADTRDASVPLVEEPVVEEVPALTAAELDAIRDRYRGELMAHLGQYLKYPIRDIRRKHGAKALTNPREGVSMGEVVMRIAVSREGDVNTATVQRKSGEKFLDRAALSMVLDANPLPAMPTELEDEEFVFTAPVYLRPNS